MAGEKWLNLGPKSRQMLSLVGIETMAELNECGAIAAYLRVRQNVPNVSLNLLWALEGALHGQAWQVIAREERLRLLMELEQAQLDPRYSSDSPKAVAG